MTSPTSTLTAVNDSWHFYQLALHRGFAALSAWPAAEIDLSIKFLSALLDNLPGPLWEKRRLFLQAAPLPQINSPLYEAVSGLPAVELDKETILLDIGQKDLGFTVCGWLGALYAFADNWYRCCKKNGLSAKIKGACTQTGVEQLLAQMAFLLNSTMEELAAVNQKTDDRLLGALAGWAGTPWRPQIYFHNTLKSPKNEQKSDLATVLSSLDLHQTPLHLIITDVPAFTDLLSPYTRELRDVLITWQQQNPELIWAGQELQNCASKQNEDYLYWILRDFLAQKEDLANEYIKANATCGIVERHGLFGTPGSYTLIDLSALEIGLTDPRLLLKNNNKRQNGLLLILPLQDDIFTDNLQAVFAAENITLSSVTLYKRAHALNGSSLQLPMAWIDGPGGHVAIFNAHNMVGADHLQGLTGGAISAGVITSLPGSYWVTPEIETALEQERLAIAYDQEGAALINTIQTALLQNHQLAPTWSWRALYYTNSAPFEESSWRQGLNSPPALGPCYSGACAILRSLLGTGQKQESATAAPAKRSSSQSGSGFRLRV